MAIEVNGVSLPDIPEVLLTPCPFAVIAQITAEDGTVSYLLCMSESSYFYIDGAVMGSSGEGIMTTGQGVGTNATAGESAWSGDSTKNTFMLGVDAEENGNNGEYSLVWANHDVLAVTGFDSSYNFVFGDVYFADSSYVYAEAYAVQTTKLKELSKQVRRVSGVSASKVTVDAMISAMTEVDVTDKLALRVNGTLSSYSSDEITKVGAYSFASVIHLKSVSLPAATSVGDQAFLGDILLESVNLPLVTDIGESAFNTCGSLTSVNFPAVTSIGEGAFSLCNKLVKADFGAVTKIGIGAFMSCKALETLIIRTTTGICKLIIEDDQEGYGEQFMQASAAINVYVPSALLAEYQANAAWTESGVTFLAIEDHPDICGTT